MNSKKKIIEAQKASLKADIIKFLDTGCKLKKCGREQFWNLLSAFTKKKICRSKYGVSKMNNILPEFDDILYYDEQYIYLRPKSNRDEPVIVSLDSDDSLEESVTTTSFSLTNTSSSKMANTPSKTGMNITPWGAGLVSTSRAGDFILPFHYFFSNFH